jgi:hypothetical protein
MIVPLAVQTIIVVSEGSRRAIAWHIRIEQQGDVNRPGDNLSLLEFV